MKKLLLVLAGFLFSSLSVGHYYGSAMLPTPVIRVEEGASTTAHVCVDNAGNELTSRATAEETERACGELLAEGPGEREAWLEQWIVSTQTRKVRTHHLRGSTEVRLSQAAAQAAYPGLGRTQSIPAPEGNDPPIWPQTPTPSFQFGIASSYCFIPEMDLVDPEGDTLGLTSTGATLPASVTLNDATDCLDYAGSGSVGTTTGIQITANDGFLSTPSPNFSIVITDVSALQWTPQNAGSCLSQLPSRNGTTLPASPLRAYDCNWGGYEMWPGTNPTILRVRNHMNSGTESFRACWESNISPRVCIVEVAGVIRIDGDNLNTSTGYMTITCATAPGPVWVVNVAGPTHTSRGQGSVFQASHPYVVTDNCIFVQEGVVSNRHEVGTILGAGSYFTAHHTTMLGGTDETFSWEGNCDPAVQTVSCSEPGPETGLHVTVVDSLVGNPNNVGNHNYVQLIGGNSTEEHARFTTLLGNVYANSRLRAPRSASKEITLCNHYVYNSFGTVTEFFGKNDNSNYQFFINISDYWYESGPNSGTDPVITLDATPNRLGLTSQVYLNRVMDNGSLPGNPWTLVNDQLPYQSNVRFDMPTNLPTGMVCTSISGMSRADRFRLQTRTNGAWFWARPTSIQSLYNGINNKTSSFQNSFTYSKTSNSGPVTYDVGASPHGDINMNGYPDLMDKLANELQQRMDSVYP